MNIGTFSYEHLVNINKHLYVSRHSLNSVATRTRTTPVHSDMRQHGTKRLKHEKITTKTTNFTDGLGDVFTTHHKESHSSDYRTCLL